jgi:hypothetical protein
VATVVAAVAFVVGALATITRASVRGLSLSAAALAPARIMALQRIDSLFQFVQSAPDRRKFIVRHFC